MKKLIATLLLVTLPLSAQAAEGEIIWIEDTPIIQDHGGETFGMRYATVGHFLNIKLPTGELTSVEIPKGAVGFTLFEDASVEFRFPKPRYIRAPETPPVKVTPPLPKTSPGLFAI